MKIASIGGGNMAEAIISSLLSAGLATPADISASDVSPDRRALLSTKYGIRSRPDNTLEGQEIVLLAVKPQVLSEVMPGLRTQLVPSQLVISIIAGKSLATLKQGLGHDSLVRSMPNTPAQIGEGMTVWTATREVSAAQKRAAASILGVLGLEIFVEEERFLDMATAWRFSWKRNAFWIWLPQ
jgi:pyrroline-5-carboxylate reductase